MQRLPEVTVVVATYDRSRWLAEALRSLLESADEAKATVRILVVDDGSPGAAAKLTARRFGVEYVRLPENRGFGAARLAGVERSTGDYLAFFDDDDVAMKSWLPMHLDKIEQGFDVVVGSYIETDAELVRLRTHVLEPATFEGLLAGRVPVNDGALIRRSILEGVTWHPERGTVLMLSLWLELAARGARFTTVARPTWYRRLHDANMSSGIGELDARLRLEAIAEFVR